MFICRMKINGLSYSTSARKLVSIYKQHLLTCSFLELKLEPILGSCFRGKLICFSWLGDRLLNWERVFKKDNVLFLKLRFFQENTDPPVLHKGIRKAKSNTMDLKLFYVLTFGLTISIRSWYRPMVFIHANAVAAAIGVYVCQIPSLSLLEAI